MSRSPALRDHIAAGILDIAAGVLADRGEAASMVDIADAAGVGRATLYRYFPNREALVRALYETALTDLAARITDAQLDSVPVAEAVARLTRAVIAATSKYRALGLFTKTLDESRQADRDLFEPFRALFHRAAAEGALRTDVPVDTLVAIYVGLLEGTIARVIGGRLGIEQASGAVTAVFLTGALHH